jgi:site-specific recombinase XerD
MDFGRTTMYYTEDFIKHLKETRYRRHTTLQEYRSLINKFCQYCQQRGLTDIREVRKADALGFLDSIREEERITDAIRIKIYRLLAYFRYLEDTGLIFVSPLGGYRIPKAQKSHYPVISRNDMDSILAKIPVNRTLSFKGKAILEIAYSSALRPQELYHLKISDIDFQNRMLFIQQSKNKKDRFVPVGRKALYWVDRYIREVRPRYVNGKTHDYVFVSHKTGQPLTVYGIRWAIQETLRLICISSFILYSLRRSADKPRLVGGMGVMHISQLLGHRNITTTQVYLDLPLRELKKELSTKHPRKRMEAILNKEKENESHEVSILS